MTLRAFCAQHALDPGNVSKIERGRAAPPIENLAFYADILGLEEGSDDRQAFIDSANAERGKIPKDLLDDAELVEKLPVLFRMIRGAKVDCDGIDGLIEKIRKA